jgi:hypothetical protein
LARLILEIEAGQIFDQRALEAFFANALLSLGESFAAFAFAALDALRVRCSGVSFFAVAGPPLRPPRRPKATAAGFLSGLLDCERVGIGEFFVSQKVNEFQYIRSACCVQVSVFRQKLEPVM